MTPTPASLLAAALRSDPARPLLTFHDHASGERTELSVATFANWVAKTANLLRDDLDAASGDRLAVHLPLHWQAAVFLQAGWALGLVVEVGGAAPGTGAADITVLTHAEAHGAGSLVSLGLGPMGLARPGDAPSSPGALDYDREVHGHGDRLDAVPAGPDAAALAVPGARLTAAELAAAALAAPVPDGSLLVTDAFTTLPAVLGGLLVPLASGTTAVLCRHADPSRLAGTIEQERVVAAVAAVATLAPALLPAWRPAAPGMP